MTPGSDAVSPLLSVRNLSVEFATGHGWDRVVDGVSFDLGRGETVGIVGESGSGKSVTCLALTGLIPSSGRVPSGSVSLDGLELLRLNERQLEDVRGRDVAMIFQEPMTSLNPAFTVGQQIAEMVRRHKEVGRQASMARAVDMLKRVGIANAAARANEYPYQFSGGMLQRVMIAMALACDPKVLIADEPTTALDVTIQAQVLDLLREVQAEAGMSLIFITHDLGVVADICGSRRGDVRRSTRRDCAGRRSLPPSGPSVHRGLVGSNATDRHARAPTRFDSRVHSACIAATAGLRVSPPLSLRNRGLQAGRDSARPTARGPRDRAA